MTCSCRFSPWRAIWMKDGYFTGWWRSTGHSEEQMVCGVCDHCGDTLHADGTATRAEKGEPK